MNRRLKKDMESLSLKNTSFLAENLWVFFRHVGTNFLQFFYGLKHTWSGDRGPVDLIDDFSPESGPTFLESGQNFRQIIKK